MARQKGTLSLASNIEPSMAAPLDAREVVNEVSDLTASGSFPYSYVGMKVVVKATGDMYILMGDDPTVSANWKKGSGGDVPTKTSDLTNDSGFIDNTVDNLVNYYLSSNTYTKTEVDNLISAAKNGRFIYVNSLPTENIDTKSIYLVPKTTAGTNNAKDEYINTDGTSLGWELIGDTEIDLSGYVQKSNTSGLLKNDGTVDESTYLTASDLTDYVQKSQTAGLLKNDGTIDETQYVSDISSKQDIMQYSTMPVAGATYADKIVQFTGTTDVYINGYFYKCVENNGTYSWEQTDVQPSGGSGGDAELESAVTSNLAVGAIASGTTLAQGTTFTQFVQKLLITEIAPTTTFSASGSGVKEVGTSVTPTLTLTITGNGTGTPTSIKFYDGSTLLDTQAYVSGTNTYTYTMSAVTTTTTVKGVLEYTKSDTTSATVEKSATYTFVMASYYGAVTNAPTDKAGIIALTKNVKNTKALTNTFNLTNQKSCYCYPASFGDLTSIKDANNFEYLSSYTKTTVAVDGVNYNVYTLTDPVTATGFKQVYA